MCKKLCGDLVIELTRRCNMACQHCLRGCAQAIDINKELIRKAIYPFDRINTLTLTGGEPSLVPRLISYTIECLIEHEVELGAFYIVTNGKVYSPSMVRTLRRAYQYADDKDMCCLTVSVDPFHDDNCKVLKRYENEIFYHPDKISPRIEDYLINEGRAYENGIGIRNLDPRCTINSEYTYDYTNHDGDDVLVVSDNLIYVTAIGDVLLECDLSYENQELYSIGNLNHSSFIDIVESHIE